MIAECKDYSVETFLKSSPDGKHLAFVYVTPKQIESDQKTSGNTRTFGFLNLETLEVKVIEVPAYNSSLSWSDEGKSFDYLSYTKEGAAILRQDLNQKLPAQTILELEKEVIYRFDWSADGKNLAIGRGKYKMDLVVLKTKLSTN